LRGNFLVFPNSNGFFIENSAKKRYYKKQAPIQKTSFFFFRFLNGNCDDFLQKKTSLYSGKKISGKPSGSGFRLSLFSCEDVPNVRLFQERKINSGFL